MEIIISKKLICHICGEPFNEEDYINQINCYEKNPMDSFPNEPICCHKCVERFAEQLI